MRHCIVLFLLLINSLLAQTLQDGLVSYYPFNGNANDESGNGNNGIVHGASLTTDRFGQNNQAYYFNGASYIELPNSFFNGSTSVSAMTYSFWFNVDVMPDLNSAYILSGKEGFWRMITLGLNGDGTISFGRSQPSPQSYFSIISAANIYQPNRWYHIGLTYSNSTLKLYLNGQLVQTASIIYSSLDYSFLALGNSTATNYIGAIHPVSPGITQYMKGKIDDFRLYDRALSDIEVLSLYNQAQIPDGLVSYYPFNGNANDESGNGNNGNTQNTQNVIGKSGLPNSAIFFNGAKSSINFPQPFLGGGQVNEFSMFARVKHTSPGNIWGKYYFWGEINFKINLNNQAYIFWANSNGNNTYSTVTTTNPISPNQWNDIVFVYSNSQGKFYINGSQVPVNQSLVLQGGSILSTTQLNSLCNFAQEANTNNMGFEVVGSVNTNYFSGTIDEFRIWNRSLSDIEVFSLYNQAQTPNGILAYYPFNGNTNDQSGNGHSGVIMPGTNGSITYTTDRYGNGNSAILFASNPNWNKLGPYIQIPNHSDLYFNSEYTINYFIQVSGTNSIGEIINKGPDNLPSMFQRVVGNVFHVGLSDISYTDNTIINNWHMITVTRSSNGTGNFYYDGQLKVTGTINNSNNTSYNLVLGAMISGGSNGSYYPYQGKLDDLSFYNRVLTNSEIQQLLNQAAPVELTSFSATLDSRVILLKWNTATETKNLGFDIERKTETSNEFVKIGFVNGAGNSNSPKTYSFTDYKLSKGKTVYRLKQIDTDGSFKYSSEVEVSAMPSVFSLSQNYPNPFNPETVIQYTLPKNANVKVIVYNTLGEEVTRLVDGIQASNFYEVKFNAKGFASGVYFYKIECNAVDGREGFHSIKKMIVLK